MIEPYKAEQENNHDYKEKIMTHVCNILTFDASMSKNAIIAECNEWSMENMNWDEGYLDIKPNFTSKVFRDFEAAEECLKNSFGNYGQLAVQYMAYPEMKPSRKMESITNQIEQTRARLNDLENTVHYADPSMKSKTVTCKNCHAVLPREWFGRTIRNNCPVCREDLRPASVLNRIEQLNKKISQLEKQLTKARMKNQAENQSKAVKRWAIAVETHI